jgi:glycosyltransferase involved in cell wall biosynthesis
MMSKAVKRFEGGRRFVSPPRGALPLVSIIVVVFRACREIPPLLDSILAVKSSEVEVIVIDGGSDDGTVQLLRDYDHRIDYWLSEPDTGIYNAMNKGLAAAKGGYVLHLNAGDQLKAIPFNALRRSLVEGYDVVSCRVLMDKTIVFSPKVGRRLLIENTWHHQGTFYRLLARPKYDENYRVFGDFDLNQRLAKQRSKVLLLDDVVAEHKNDGISVTGREQHSEELWKSVRANAGLMYVPIAFAWYKLSPLRRQIAPLRRSFVLRLSRDLLSRKVPEHE